MADWRLLRSVLLMALAPVVFGRLKLAGMVLTVREKLTWRLTLIPPTALRMSSCFWKRRLVPPRKVCEPLTKLTLSTNCHVVISRWLSICGTTLNGSRGRLRMYGTGVGSGFVKRKAKLLRPTTNSFVTREVGVQR